MRHLLNTLYVSTQAAYLHREGETVVIRVDGEARMQIPIHNLGGIVCFGQVSCSPALMAFCAERNVTISFLSEHGRFLARVEGPVYGNVLLRREQYRRADSELASAAIARNVVLAKVANCRTVLLRSVREHPNVSGSAEVSAAADHLGGLMKGLEGSIALDSARGIEGEAARKYFSVFDHLIVCQKQKFFFKERSRRPPLDNTNALLSFLYTVLARDVAGALETVGLDPAVGFLHRDRPGRPGLALDLMEEFRPILADRLVLSLINLQQITGTGFQATETGAVMMTNETRKVLLKAYQERKQEKIQHPFLGEKVEVGLLPYIQALLMARHLRGDLDGYPPFLWK
jgi:CRISPR-associated protein Cas1